MRGTHRSFVPLRLLQGDYRMRRFQASIVPSERERELKSEFLQGNSFKGFWFLIKLTGVIFFLGGEVNIGPSLVSTFFPLNLKKFSKMIRRNFTHRQKKKLPRIHRRMYDQEIKIIHSEPLEIKRKKFIYAYFKRTAFNLDHTRLRDRFSISIQPQLCDLIRFNSLQVINTGIKRYRTRIFFYSV